ncbi:nicotinate-nucleotide adenylyltransferase [Achromobacter deleyi]|uniref:nicotinate (nicotinamide) nucleotide adenylyltransferase n=1 Tax=Achromobacter deleyi TaxID=1353891 RepID=UPI00285EEBEA|nr:nicotinate (nicotinamide) nucleotide adenylyltransferase [Achromobacter deleyi]MDR6602942.1 nicotinate-nucleotide adenylyltransferase [Achromobacter deleyi]
MKRIGLLGGSFDPVHVAHVALARNALQTLGLAAVQLIPAANPWQRAALHATGEQRCDMLELAIAGQDGLVVNPIEIERGGPTYTIDTLRALPRDARYVWLLGADQLANFCTWRNWRDIASLVDLAVATRPGTPLKPPAELSAWLDEHGHRLEELPFAPMAVSASEIRRRLAAGESTDGLLPPAVAAYIAAHQLYR